MNFLKAVASGRPFKRPYFEGYIFFRHGNEGDTDKTLDATEWEGRYPLRNLDDNSMSSIDASDILAKDWEVLYE